MQEIAGSGATSVAVTTSNFKTGGEPLRRQRAVSRLNISSGPK
jgi:hypothetical protein